MAVLKKAQGREFEASVACEKNALLASTILLTSVSESGVFDPSDILLERFVAELVDCLENRIPSKVAASCVRSLLLLGGGKGGESGSGSASAADEAVVALLIPRCIAFITQDTETEGLEASRTLITSALTSWVPTLGPQRTPTALALILPALLARASNEGSSSFEEIAGNVLGLASSVGGEVFKGVVGGLGPGQRAFLERVLREGAPRRREAVREESGEPSIALKMEF